MCRVEMAEPWDICDATTVRARKAWRCTECRRRIEKGERYCRTKGLADAHWAQYETCLHCTAAGEWLTAVCGGWMFTEMYEEMREHWEEGYTSIPFGRLIAGVRLGWHDGRDPIPDKEQVRQLATAMMRGRVYG